MKCSRTTKTAFHRIKSVSRTNIRNVKQPEAQKSNKKVAKLKGQASLPTDGTNFEEVFIEKIEQHI